MGFSAGAYWLSLRLLFTWCFYPLFSGLLALMSADIARDLGSLVCSCFNSCCTVHLFPLLILSRVECFLY